MSMDTPTVVTTVPKSGRSQVVVASCSSYSPRDVEGAVAEALNALGGLTTVFRKGQTVLIKPNLFSAHPPEHAVTTHPEIVRTVIRMCVKAGAGRIWVGDSSVGLHAEADVWSCTGMTKAVAGTPAELKSWRVKQTALECGNDVLTVPEWYAQVDAVISLPKLKSHCLTALSCGMKNVYGIVTGQAKSQFHMKYPSPLSMSAFLVRVFAQLKPQLTIVDGIVAMEGNGPAHGRPVQVGVILAGRDAVALDAVACRPLQIVPSSVPMIRLAAAGGLGQMDESMIECVGSGVALLQAAHMRRSLSRVLYGIPEFMYGMTPWLFRLRPGIQTGRCKKCGMCAAVCPKHIITKNARTMYPVIDQKKCIACFCCKESCPHGAIALQLRLGTRIPLAQRGHREVAAG
jgi:uncharacterized protein (DUF362 family)/NAD-dependent dihydropyrimidine dehydrogenase PreA subunit